MPQLDNLGLKEHPFQNSTDQRYFYADQNRTQILESTEHLIDYSSNLQVIIGVPGVGKSHLLETLSNRIDNNWRIAKINEVNQLDTLSLIQAVLDSLGAVPDEKMELLERLETQLAEIIQLGFKPVLFIDNAEKLSVDSIRFLLQLSQQKQDDEPYINIVLFATVEITERLQIPELTEFREFIHIATLDKFDKEGVSGYLRHKMAVAGFDRESPFTPRIVDSIYTNSHGIAEKVNFFASKFLSSSGKGDNYIETDKHSPVSDVKHQIGDDSTLQDVQDNNLLNSLTDDELQAHKTDRTEEQITRLTEKFEEIEKLDEQSVDDFSIDKESIENEAIDRTTIDNNFNDKQSTAYFDESSSSLGMPKFIIPVALIGIILAALLVLNTVFDRTEQTGDKQSNNENIELLPLELPAEVSFPAAESSAAQDIQQQPADNQAPEQPVETVSSESETLTELELVEVKESDIKAAAEQITTEPVIVQPVVPTEPESGIDREATVGSELVPELSAVEPEPVIGSNNRQYITFKGTKLDKDMSLVVGWGSNKKEFSAKLTPEQWHYESEAKVRLYLSTGIESQQWQVYARNKQGQQSAVINFDVVKPFIPNTSIKSISPNPITGANERQAVTINGQGFSKQAIVELKWDNNSKQFSSRLTPSQFELVSSQQIKLFVTTGKKERLWNVSIKHPSSESISSASFSVVSESSKGKSATVAASASPAHSSLRDKSWLQQQLDTNFTIQLFGSHNKQAIVQLIQKYSLQGDMAWFATQRNGQNWYSLTYGNYASRKEAITAMDSLKKELTEPKPWIRSFESIKKQLQLLSSNASNTAKQQSESVKLSRPGSEQGKDGVKGEAWIWTQNPSDFTVQLLALSTEQAVKSFIEVQKIKTQAAYFKINRNGKPLYILIYGSYPDKKAAEQAKTQLALKFKDSTPWVREFSDVHGVMSSR